MKTLLLDSVYQPIAFITTRNLAKKIAKEKVDIVSLWDDEYLFRDFQYPAVVKLKDYVRKRIVSSNFSRKGVFKRDKFTCQYTGIVYSPARLTIDHVIPKSMGGKNTWENCVTCSIEANSRKGNRTPEQARMTLIKQPCPPVQPIFFEYFSIQDKHPDWSVYFPDDFK